MSLITIEDQSPIMRRAKIRATVAVVLLLIAAGSLLMLTEQAPSTNQIKTAAEPAKVAVAKTPSQQIPTSPQIQTTPQPQTQPGSPSSTPEAKPPVAPPDPVYTSFTAPAAPAAEPLIASALPAPIAPSSPNMPAPQAVPENKPAQMPPVPAQPAQLPQQEVAQTQPPVPPAAKPANPRPERVATKIETSLTGSHILQVGVFADMNNARKQQAKLSASGIPAHTSTLLKIGPFSNMAEIDTAREKVRTSGINVSLADDIVSGAKGSSLSAGQYADMDQAMRLQASLSEHGLPANTETRLLVGPFANKAKADAARNKIKKLNISVVLMPNH